MRNWHGNLSPFGNLGSGRREQFDQDRASLVALYPRWFLFGEWDDTLPTGAAWADATAWIVEGQWLDLTDTTGVAPTWTSPTGDATPFTIWDDGIAT